MQNEQTYYAVLVTYPMPDFMNMGGVIAAQRIMDTRFFTRATTMREVYIDMRQFAIDRRLEELNMLKMASDPDAEEVTDLSLEEMEGLWNPKIVSLVEINDPHITAVLSEAISVAEMLKSVSKAWFVLPGEQPMRRGGEAHELSQRLDDSTRHLIQCHLAKQPNPTEYLLATEAILGTAHEFITTLRTPTEVKPV